VKFKLKNYRVIKKIGHGGMGLVYVAEDLARADEFMAHYESIQEQWREKYPDIWPRVQLLGTSAI
jgi:hypothetical protein